MQKTVNRCLAAVEQRYKQGFDNFVRKQQKFTVGDEVFVTLLPLAAFPNKDTETVLRFTNNKLIQRSKGPYKIVEVWEYNVIVDRNESQSRSPFTIWIPYPNVATEKWTQGRSTIQMWETQSKKSDTTRQRTTKNLEEYTIDQIIRHVMRKDGLRYVVRWYRVNTVEDTKEPAENITTHFVNRYWRSKPGNRTTDGKDSGLGKTKNIFASKKGLKWERMLWRSRGNIEIRTDTNKRHWWISKRQWRTESLHATTI